MAKTPAKKPRLTSQQWAEAALTAIEEGGVAAVSVEPIAQRLGVTKGSFYWHFKNRDALLQAALELWEQRSTDAIIAEVTPSGGPRDVLLALARRGLREPQHGRIEVVLASAAHDPRVQPMLAKVMRRRREFVANLLEQAGHSSADAADRSLLTYATFLGLYQLFGIDPALTPTDAHEEAFIHNWLEMVFGSAGT